MKTNQSNQNQVPHQEERGSLAPSSCSAFWFLVLVILSATSLIFCGMFAGFAIDDVLTHVGSGQNMAAFIYLLSTSAVMVWTTCAISTPNVEVTGDPLEPAR